MLHFIVTTIFNRFKPFLLTLFSSAFPFWKTGPSPSSRPDPVSDCPASCTYSHYYPRPPRNEWLIRGSLPQHTHFISSSWRHCDKAWTKLDIPSAVMLPPVSLEKDRIIPTEQREDWHPVQRMASLSRMCAYTALPARQHREEMA